MTSAPTGVGEAFRRLQAGDAAGALECARRAAEEQPANARAHLAAGIALRMSGRFDEATKALARAQSLDPSDHAAEYEIGVVNQLEGRIEAALGHFERCARLRPDFFAAHFSAGLILAERREWARAADCFRAVVSLQPTQPDALLHLALALERGGHHGEAEAAFVHALATNPHHAPTVRVFGQYSASRGNFRRAASLFAEAMRLEPDDAALAMFVAQSELLLGRWPAAWGAYARREPRREFERAAAARGAPYSPPRLADIAGRRITLVAEQGLGDTLFFLRWAPFLKATGARLAFVGDARLHGMLARTRLFERIDPPQAAAGAMNAVLVGDLPSIDARDPLAVPTLAIPPLPDRVAAWQEVLRSAGPRPWIGVQWRAGTPREKVAHALSKSVPVQDLFARLAGLPGTIVALQRDLAPGELDGAARAAGRPVHDLSRANADLEDALALVTLLDRHVAVSSTTLHLAAAAGATADVLVPFPPEWRWRSEGDSPWFPGFRVHRQAIDGDWSAALASAASRG
jgi:tetratricopeptide (TPR) repeat protein